MRSGLRDPEKAARYLTIATLSVMVAWGMVSVLFEVRPFWVDEWRIIYNLKFKTVPEIWGKLAFMQQFPRTYLALLKLFTASFDYNYWSLRLPSFIVALVTILSLYRLCGRLYPQANYTRFLLVLMLVSCGTFTEYFVQIKQYTMDLLLCVVAIWQLVYLLDESDGKLYGKTAYVALCLGFFFAPFFSYTYPIVITPVYGVILLQNIAYWKSSSNTQDKIKVIFRQWLPLFFCTFSITVFYLLDVSQLTADKDMKNYWGHLMLNNGFHFGAFCEHVFHVFAQAGSGFLFWWLFGLLCSAAFVYAVYVSCRNVYTRSFDTPNLVLLYSVLLLLLMIALHAAGKLPLGEPRLNAFAIPAISILLIRMLEALSAGRTTAIATRVVFFALLLGLCGNIFSTVAASFTDDKYARRMEIYRATEKALKVAKQQKLPVLITPGVAFPYDNTINFPFTNTVPGDWVLMTFPAYKVGESMPVYAIEDTAHIQQYLGQLPPGVSSAMIGDGLNYRIVKRGD